LEKERQKETKERKQLSEKILGENELDEKMRVKIKMEMRKVGNNFKKKKT